MTVGERIRGRRKDLDLSADELAVAVGISRSTIFRYENGDIEKLPITVLEPIAEALHTTPTYLMGWTDDPVKYEDPESVAKLIGIHDNSLPGIRGGDAEAAIKPKTELDKSGADKHYRNNRQEKQLRSVARMEGADITPEEDENIRNFIEFLISQREKSE